MVDQATSDARRKRQFFASLGIDVWVRREERSSNSTSSESVPADSVAHSDPVETSAVAAPVDAAPRGAGQTATKETAWPAAFTIHCFHLGSVFVAVDEALWSKRRFFLDVARAWDGYSAAERQMVRFDWPQGGLDTGADRSFQAFFEHQASTASHRLVCGPLVLLLLGETPPADVSRVGGAVYLDGQTTPAAKIRIWRHLLEAT